MKKPPCKVKILGDTKDAIIISQEQEVYPTYPILASQIKVGYKEDHQGNKDPIKVDRRRYRKRLKNVKVTKSVNCNDKQSMKLRSGVKVGKHQKKGDDKCQVKIEPKCNIEEGYKSKLNEKSKNIKGKKVEMECKRKSNVVQK